MNPEFINSMFNEADMPSHPMVLFKEFQERVRIMLMLV